MLDEREVATTDTSPVSTEPETILLTSTKSENADEMGDNAPESSTGTEAELDASEKEESQPSIEESPKMQEIIAKRIGEVNRKHAAELTKAQRELEIARQALKLEKGETFEDRLIEEQAYERNVTPDVIRKEREIQAAIIAQQVENHPDVIEARNEKYKRMADDDFRELKAAFPDLKAENMDEVVKELGADMEKFFALRIGGGIAAETAYQTILTERARHTQPMPPVAGDTTNITEERDHLTEDEMNNIDPMEVADNPKLYAKWQKGMKKLGL